MLNPLIYIYLVPKIQKSPHICAFAGIDAEPAAVQLHPSYRLHAGTPSSGDAIVYNAVG